MIAQAIILQHSLSLSLSLLRLWFNTPYKSIVDVVCDLFRVYISINLPIETDCK